MRYHAQSDTYYIQIQGTQYAQLDKKIKRVTTYMEHIRSEERAEERKRLIECRRRLLQERRKSQYYIAVSPSDLPPDAHARPIYDLPGQIVAVGQKRYAELLDRL